MIYINYKLENFLLSKYYLCIKYIKLKVLSKLNFIKIKTI